MTARPPQETYPSVLDIPQRQLIDFWTKLSFACRAETLTGDELLAVVDDMHARAELVAFAKALAVNLTKWGPVRRYYVSNWWGEIAPGVSASRLFETDPTTVLVAREHKNDETGGSYRTNRSHHPRSEWMYVAPGVQIRRPTNNGADEYTIEVRTKAKPVVEEAETANAEAGWRQPVSYYWLHGWGLQITSEVWMGREDTGNAWRVQTWEKVWSVVDGSKEWREINPCLQVRWPNGPSDGLIEVRTRG